MKGNICFFIEDNELLEKYNGIWEKVKNSITNKIKINNKPSHNKIHLKTETKSCNGKINTSFHNNKIPAEVCKCIYLSLILIKSILNMLLKKKRCISLLLTI